MLIRGGIFTADVLMQFGNGLFVLLHVTEPLQGLHKSAIKG